HASVRGVQLDDAVVARVGDPQVAAAVVGDAGRRVELPGRPALRGEAGGLADAPELAAVGAVGVEVLDALVEGVGDAHAARGVERHAAGARHVARPAAGQPPRGQQVAGGVEGLDAVVGGVGDVDAAARVVGQAADGAHDRELPDGVAGGAERADGGQRRRVEDVDAAVDVVGDVELVVGVDRDVVGVLELA